MKLRNVEEIESFLEAVGKCKGDVYLRSPECDIYNLKSALSRYTAMNVLLKDHCDELDLFYEDPDDEALFIKYLDNPPHILGDDK